MNLLRATGEAQSEPPAGAETQQPQIRNVAGLHSHLRPVRWKPPSDSADVQRLSNAARRRSWSQPDLRADSGALAAIVRALAFAGPELSSGYSPAHAQSRRTVPDEASHVPAIDPRRLLPAVDRRRIQPPRPTTIRIASFSNGVATCSAPTLNTHLVSNFLQTALLPALQRLKIGPVGVFTEIGDDATKSIYTLVPFESLSADAGRRRTTRGRLKSSSPPPPTTCLSDKETPAYDRIESQLMIAFSGFPRVKTPRSGDRIFELRVYESHSELKAKLKIEMFNEAEFDDLPQSRTRWRLLRRNDHRRQPAESDLHAGLQRYGRTRPRLAGLP